MTRLDKKLARIRAGKYAPRDFIIADAKDPDMGPSMTSCGPKREKDGTITRNRTRREFLESVRAIVDQDIVDVMLTSVSNLEALHAMNVFEDSDVQPVVRLNDTTDIWVMRGATYSKEPSRPFRSASLAKTAKLTDLGLYSITFNNDLDADYDSLLAFQDFRDDAQDNDLRYFLEVFNPNVDTGIDPAVLPHYINDCIIRCLGGLTKSERPEFLKIAYNGPKALEELASFDPSLIVGVLGGGAGTARDTFELLHQVEKYGARIALFGRKINLAESPLAIVALMREVVSGNVSPAEAVRAYHAELDKEGITPHRSLDDDLAVTEAVLKHAG